MTATITGLKTRRGEPQGAPVPVTGADGQSGSLKVDRVVRLGDRTLVAGWRTADVELSLLCANGDISDLLFSTERPDVAAHFDVPAGRKLGFVLMGPAPEGRLELVCGTRERQVSYPLELETPGVLDDNAAALMMPALVSLARDVEPLGQQWRHLVSLIPSVEGASDRMVGAFDEALASAGVQHGKASGWLTVPDGVPVWIQDSSGGVHGFAGCAWIDRPDVSDALAKTLRSPVKRKPGFHVHLQGVAPGTTLHLKALDEDVVRELAAISIAPLPVDPAKASRQIFPHGGTPMSRLASRLEAVEGPIIDALIAADRARWDDVPATVQQIGDQVEQPDASIIIPLYGRTDFVEQQMIEFVRDEWLVHNAEIIYVVDDPSIADRFIVEAHQLSRLYRVPFRVVNGGINRGFAGANNLGADHANAPHLLFVNSDVFPRAPGWVQSLLQVLEDRADVGVVAPRLLFADGSIQHAGMEIMRREELGVWINHHPRMGLDPALDPCTELTEVPAVTGACMALRRSDFERVGGWETGYLIGDFEDSDLCLKLRERGLKSAYLPQVSLTHLERQSFRLLGAGEYRNQVVIYNALRHQRRWKGLLEALAQEEA